MVTAKGIIIVEISIMKRKSRSGHWMRENPYATSEEDSTAPITLIAQMVSVLSRYLKKGMNLIAVR